MYMYIITLFQVKFYILTSIIISAINNSVIVNEIIHRMNYYQKILHIEIIYIALYISKAFLVISG